MKFMIICDADRLEESLPRILQLLEATGDVILCVNDAGRKWNTRWNPKRRADIDIRKLRRHLGISVIALSSASRETGRGKKKREKEEKPTEPQEQQELERFRERELTGSTVPVIKSTNYDPQIENYLDRLEPAVRICFPKAGNSRFLAARLLTADEEQLEQMKDIYGKNPLTCRPVAEALFDIWQAMEQEGVRRGALRQRMADSFVLRAKIIAQDVISYGKRGATGRNKRWI